MKQLSFIHKTIEHEAVLKLSVYFIFIILISLSCSFNKNIEEESLNNIIEIEETDVVFNSNIKTDGEVEKNEIDNNIGKVVMINSEDFKKNIHDYDANPSWNYIGDKPCIIDFYADWCAPCRMIAPILDELAQKYQGKIVIYKVNVDKEPELASFYRVANLPTMFFCKKIGNPDVHIGAYSKQEYVNIIENFLLK